MSCYSTDHLDQDLCALVQQNRDLEGPSNYRMNMNFYRRQGEPLPEGTLAGLPVSNYGWGSPVTVMRDSFMSRRSLLATACGGYDAPETQTPVSLFPTCAIGAKRQPCSPQDMKPMYAKDAGGCNSISENNMWVQSMFPQNFQKGYMGQSPIPGTEVPRWVENDEMLAKMATPANMKPVNAAKGFIIGGDDTSTLGKRIINTMAPCGPCNTASCA